MDQDSYKIGQFGMLPKQKVLAFKAKLKPHKPLEIDIDDDDTQLCSGEQTAPSLLEMIQGCQADFQNETLDKVDPYKDVSADEAKKMKLMNAARQIEFTREREDEFFYQEEIVKTLGISSKIRMRFGYNTYHQGWMVYTCKKNVDMMSSVIEISVIELDDVIENLERMADDIQFGLDMKQPMYHPENVLTYKVPAADQIEFWFDESTYYTASGAFRARFIWKPMNVYDCVINQVKKCAKHPTSFGPRIRFTLPEIKAYVDVLKKFREELPDPKNMEM